MPEEGHIWAADKVYEIGLDKQRYCYIIYVVYFVAALPYLLNPTKALPLSARGGFQIDSEILVPHERFRLYR